MNHILHVVGARPNFVKAAPVLRAIRKEGLRQTLVHTGQHYDRNMSDVFFTQLEIPEPDVNLGVGSGSHASQTAEIMRRFEPVVLERKPDIVLVYGDVNSTVAAALVCAKLLIPVGHVEAGLRSFDRTMPEEINRIVTDRLSDVLFTPSEDGDLNLKKEGVSAGTDSPRRQRNDRFSHSAFADCEELSEERLSRAIRVGYVASAFQCRRQRKPAKGTAISDRSEWTAGHYISRCTLEPVSGSLNSDSTGESSAPSRPDALYRVSLSAEPGGGRHYRFRRNSGRDHLPGRALSDIAYEYGTSDHSGNGNQHPGRR